MKLKLDRMTINVKNLEEAKRFFSELLETTFEDMPEEMVKGRQKIEISPPAPDFKFRFAVSPIGIELFETDPPVAVEGVRNVTWRVENIEQAREEMKKRGIERVFDARCGSWKEAVYKAEDVHGVRWVLNEYEGESVMKAMGRKEK
ncbi:MAG: hypothetical protein A2157_02110 [Deltaproteobacteria bacterium RBG_16_47_11]|nr:MAG: hypothetical protein A2157_02110 [Deltaproteobacteria bacterium RBG_16_47_11]